MESRRQRRKKKEERERQRPLTAFQESNSLLSEAPDRSLGEPARLTRRADAIHPMTHLLYFSLSLSLSLVNKNAAREGKE